MRNDEKFTAFYSSVVSSSQQLTDDPVLPRYRRRPRRFDEGEHPHHFATPEDRYRQVYFEVLENCCGEIDNRFAQSDLTLISSLEKLLLDAANGEVIRQEIPSYLSHYLSEQEIVQLKAQLPMLPGAIDSTLSGSVKHVTNVRTVCDALNGSEIMKQMLSIVHKLAVIYLTFPVTSATAERSFSSLRRVKTYLRSRMTSQRLNNLFLLYIHQSYTDTLDLSLVAKDFASSNTRRVNYFGHF